MIQTKVDDDGSGGIKGFMDHLGLKRIVSQWQNGVASKVDLDYKYNNNFNLLYDNAINHIIPKKNNNNNTHRPDHT